MMHVIYDWPLGVPIVLILLLSLSATELGYRYGRVQRAAESERDVLSTIRTGTLGLVALLLGFSFAITSNRFNDRSRLVMDEANAIGTCYLRAGLVAEPARSQMRDALRRYVDLRLQSYERGLDAEEFTRTANGMQTALGDLWAGVGAAVQADRQLVITVALVPAANDVIDLSATRLWLRSFHMPASVVVLLALCIVICGAMIGHGLGEAGQDRRLGLSLGINLLIVMVAFVVLDFDRPRRGLIRVDQTPLVQVRESMRSS
jgi:hypothetical protein